MPKAPIQPQTIRYERANTFKASVIDSAQISLYRDSGSERLNLSFGRNDQRVLSEQIRLEDGGRVTFEPNTQKTELVKVVEFDALVTPTHSVEIVKAIAKTLGNLPLDRQKSLQLEDKIAALLKLFY